MLTESVEQLFMPFGPILGRQFNFDVTSTSAHIDLSSAGDNDSDALKVFFDGGLLLELEADDDVGYRWSTATTGEEVSLAATITTGTAAHQCRRLFAGASKVERPPPGTQGIVVISAVAATILRVTVVSKSKPNMLKFP